MTRRLLVATVVLALVGCSKPDAQTTAPSASATAAPAPVSAAPLRSAAPKAPWFEGPWHGSYEAQRYKLEAPKNEGAREWKDDDGGAHTGDGTIALEVSAAGTISGRANGPLGSQTVSGEVDGELFRIRFVPSAGGARSFHGVAVLRREGAALGGRIQSSSGDSLTVRDAAIELSKGEASAAATPVPSASAD
jgi:hypothetical protein